MAANREDLSRWFDKGILEGKGFMIVVCDTFNHEDYPVYCKAENFDKIYQSYNGVNMQTVMEVYDLSLSKDSQMGEHRAFHFPVGSTVANTACT